MAVRAASMPAANPQRRETIDSFDKDTLEKFITTNRNRSPEPFVRTTTSM